MLTTCLIFSLFIAVRKKIKTPNLSLVALSPKETLDLPYLTMVCGHIVQLVVGDLEIAQQPTSVVLKSNSTCRRSSVSPRM